MQNAWGGQQPNQQNMQDRDRKKRALRATGRNWGQQQGYGQGYMPPRRQVGGQHTPARDRIGQGRGYNPRTAGGMYGGRPSQQVRQAANVNVTSIGAQQAAQRRNYGPQPVQPQGGGGIGSGQMGPGQPQYDQVAQAPPLVPQNPYNQNQQQAMTRQATTARAQITRPYGGTQAVQRRRPMQANRGW